MIEFKQKIRKDGNSHVITIPSDFLKHNILKEGTEYTFSIDEKNEVDNNEKRDERGTATEQSVQTD